MERDHDIMTRRIRAWISGLGETGLESCKEVRAGYPCLFSMISLDIMEKDKGIYSPLRNCPS